MKKLLTALLLLCSLTARADFNIYENFQKPQNEFGEYAFWWWTWDVSDKWSKEGITKALEEMSQKGMGGVMLFTIGDSRNPGGIAYMGPQFVELFKHAATECARLNMKLAFQICDGWATAGGAWITPELAMKKLVQKGFNVLGGTKFKAEIELPEIVDGYYKDIAVLAFPHGADVFAESDVFDLTDKLNADGVLKWNAPEGRNWTVIRYGYTLTGARNGPANASGYECDKLDPKGVEAHFAHQAKVLLDACAGLPADKLPIPWQDSYEAGSQNWTERMPQFFKERNGYDIGKNLIAFSTETPLVSAGSRQKFLDDFWGTVWDSMRKNYVLRLKELSNAAGRPFISETYPEEADIPVGEFWLVSRPDIAHTPKDQIHCGNVEDFRSAIWTPNTFGIAKRAQFAGKNVVGAEAWTTRAPCFERTFSDLKAGANFVFAQGVNMLIHHNFVNQWDGRKPGAFNHGVAMNQNQTWWADIAEGWFAFIARSQYMLRLGRPVFDILAIDSSDGARAAERVMPNNADFAVCTAGDFMKLAKIEDGKMTNGIGDEFKAVLVMDEYLSPEVSEKLNGFKNVHRANAGGLEKVLEVAGPGVGKLPDGVHFTGRSADGLDIYFFANSLGESVEFECALSGSKRPAQIWNAENGERTRFDGKLKLNAGQGLFVLAGKGISELPSSADLQQYYVADISKDWTLRFDKRYGAPSKVNLKKLNDWTKSDNEAVKYYSSTAVYEKDFEVKGLSAAKKILLDLGVVGDYAKVYVNGREVAILWTPPFECDITKFVREGQNELKIRVVNTWTNRLIGDAATGEKYLSAEPSLLETEPFTKDSPLRPAGLIGPARIVYFK